MSRIAVAVSCTSEVMIELVRLSTSRTDEARMVERARIVLGCVAGKRNDEVAEQLGIRAGTVEVWRKRSVRKALPACRIVRAAAQPPTYPPDLKQRILRQLEQPPPPGLSAWDGGTLAHALGVSDDAVWRVLRKEGVQLRRHRSWCVSTDPQFAPKAADIIGLYLSPPRNAHVLCVDEKPSIQALECKIRYVPTSSCKIVRGLKSTYKRYGSSICLLRSM